MAQLHGGPADGLTIDDDSPIIIWVASQIDAVGRRVPMLDDKHDPPRPTLLPQDVHRSTDMLMDQVAGHWECYRKIGSYAPELGQYLDPISDTAVGYRWVSPGYGE